MPLIEVRQLTKTFRTFERRPGLAGAVRNLFSREHRLVRAVDGISFEIEPGQLVGYIGPNGAGKSTTVKMLCGILTPTSGEARVNGLLPYRDRIANARQMGVMFGQRTSLWWDLAVAESFDLLRQMYAVPAETYRRNLSRFEEVLGIGPLMGTPVRQLSLGQRVRCDLAACFLHDPPVVYLDEPTIGLDVAVKDRIRAFLRELNAEQGTTILLTTHDLGDIEEICRRIMVIDQGRLLYDGDLAAFKAHFGQTRTVVFQFREPVSPEAAAGLAPALGLDPRELVVETVENGHLSFRFPRHRTSASEVVQRVMEAFPVLDLTVQEPRIEVIVREIYRRSAQEKPA